jgi:hypothetical protein
VIGAIRDINSGISELMVLCSRTHFCALFPMGLVTAVVSPRMSSIQDNLRIHQTFIAILLPPLVPLVAMAAGRIRTNVTKGVRAGG